MQALDLTDDGLERLAKKAGRNARLLTVRCDVMDAEQQAAAFQQHVHEWGGLDVAILNAGISESGAAPPHTTSWSKMDQGLWQRVGCIVPCDRSSDSLQSYKHMTNVAALAGDIFNGASLTAFQKTLDVDLGAVLTGVHLASRTMQRAARPGVILSIASAAGVFALPDAPVYSAAKGGLVHFTRSAAPAAARAGLRLCTVCPQFVDTDMVAGLDPKLRAWISDKMGSLLTRQAVVDELDRLVRDDSKNGIAFVMLQVCCVDNLACSC